MLFGKDCSVSLHVYFSNFISISQITVGPYNQRILFSNLQFIFLIIYCPSIIVSFPTTWNVKFLIIEKQPLPTCASRKEEIYVIVKKKWLQSTKWCDIYSCIFFFSVILSVKMLKKQLFMGIQGTKKCSLLIRCFFSFFSLF